MEVQRPPTEESKRPETGDRADPPLVSRVGSVGGALRRARERRGLSIAQVAQATKIRAVTLAAIEKDAFDEVPGGIFRRGLLRSYAGHVGLNPEDIVRQYREQFEPEPVAPEPSADAEERVDDVIAKPYDRVGEFMRRVHGHRQLAIGVLCMIGLVTYFAYARSRSAAEPATPGPSPAPAASADSDRNDNGAEISREPPVATAGNGSTMQIELKAVDECWVTAVVDGNRVVYRLMQEGQSERLEARNQVILRVGDPDAIVYSINGRPGRRLGPSGVPVTVSLTAQNYAQFATQ